MSSSSTELLLQYNVALLDSKRPGEKALKDSADYSAQEQEARWFETVAHLQRDKHCRQRSRLVKAPGLRST